MKKANIYGFIATAIITLALVTLSLTACDNGGETTTTFNEADGAANIGRTGPGGGKIFYYSASGFTLYTSATDTVGVTAHYLEAAPTDISEQQWWASSGFLTNDILGTSTAIGTGRKNTALILATDENAPAAKSCKDLSTGGKTDWFLPSKDELNAIYTSKTSVGIDTTNWYWSSSQFDNNNAYCNSEGYSSKGNVRLVRAVRAF